MNTIKASEVKEIMGENGIYASSPLFADAAYMVPTIAWLRGNFAHAFKKLCHSFGAQYWTAEQQDCDDFARGVAWFCAMLHNGTGFTSSAILLGEFWFIRDTGGAHAINCTILVESRQVVFFEPQKCLTGEDPIITLSDTEKQSCEFYRF